MKNSLIFCAFSLIFSSVISAASMPNAAQINRAGSSNLQFSKIELEMDNAGSYKSLVKYHDNAPIDITFNQSTGHLGNTYNVYLDDQLVKSGPIEGDTTNVSFDYQETGYFDLRIEVCDLDECISSNDQISISDTDGSHLLPLTMDIDENNLEFGSKSEKVIAGYFKETGVDENEFTVDNIPADNITHLLYGYIPTCGVNASLSKASSYDIAALQTACSDSLDYEVVILDPEAAFQRTFSQAEHDDGTPIKGNYAMMMALKQKYPSLKILATIGGETLSDQFIGLSDKGNRDVFVNSVKEFLITWKFFDGINIDWHFPLQSDDAIASAQISPNGTTYTLLVTELNDMLQALTLQTGLDYQLTSEIAATADSIAQVDYAQAADQLDYLFTKSFDFYGDDNIVGHHSGLYCGEAMTLLGNCQTSATTATPTVDNAVQLLLKQGVESQKIVVGVAMHGRGWSGIEESSFTQTNNPMSGTAKGKIFSIPSSGVWNSGIVNYKAIDEYVLGDIGEGINGFEYGFDYYAQAPYLWNENTGELISFDDANSILSKADFVNDKALGGLFSGELQADNGDILNAMNQGLQSNDIIPVALDEVTVSEVDSINAIELSELLQSFQQSDTSSTDFFKTSSVFNNSQVNSDIQLIEFDNIVPIISLFPGDDNTTQATTVAAIPSHIVEELKNEQAALNDAETTQENDVIEFDDVVDSDEDELDDEIEQTRFIKKKTRRANDKEDTNFLFVKPASKPFSAFTLTQPASTETVNVAKVAKKTKKIETKNTVVKKVNEPYKGKGSSLFGFAGFVSQFESSLNTFNELVPEANEEQEYEELTVSVYTQGVSLTSSFTAVKKLSKLTDQLKENFNNNRRDVGEALIENIFSLKGKAENLYKKAKQVNNLSEFIQIGNEQ